MKIYSTIQKAFVIALVTCAFAAVSYDSNITGQTQAQSRQLRQIEDVRSLPASPKRFALIIGVDQYADTQITTLGGSSGDAKLLADTLARYAGFPKDQIILLASDQPQERQPTRGNILRRLSNLASLVPKDGLLLVSFAGHGMERSGQAFLLPADAQVSNDVELLEQTAINVQQMKDRILKTGVKQVILLLDACRNDPVGRADSPNPLTKTYTDGFDFAARNSGVEAFATIYATKVGQRAYEYKEKHQGYFTWFVVEGLKGAAANERGEVTLAALLKYIREKVPKQVMLDLGAGREQQPLADYGGYKPEDLVISVASPNRSESATNASAETPSATSSEEDTLWDAIKESKSADDFQAYLDKFPTGKYAVEAKSRIQAVKAKPSPLSGGVLNGQAISKPAPIYPPVAKAAHAMGQVVVQVTIDEDGKVISAKAVSGHPLLQEAAVQAAYQARFNQTRLSGVPVKVTGTITYNFILESKKDGK